MKLNKLLGLVWICVAILLCFILVSKINHKSFKSNKFNLVKVYSNNNLYETKEFNSAEIKNIEIGLASESVYIEKTSGNEIIVEEYCSEKTVPKVYVVSNTLKIESNSITNMVSFENGSRRVVVKVPENFMANDVDIGVASGSVHIDNCVFKTLDIGTASGSVHVTNCKMNQLDVACASGSIHITDCDIPVLQVESASGSVRVSGKYEGVELKSMSGSVHLDLGKPLTKDSEINTSSGSINVKMPAKSDVKVKYSLGSGSYNNSITGTRGKHGTDIMGNGTVRLDMNAGSGSINIRS